MKHGEVIRGRFELIEPIGRGGQGETWRALDRERGEEVALKELELAETPDWKTVELFEREAKVLAALDHPQIPAYLDAFHSKDDSRFFIAQEYVAGASLAERIEKGARYNEDEALGILERLLEVVSYLHALNPPVVHRDIKPANIVLAPTKSEGDEAGPSLSLVDFGAVQSVLPDPLGGSTIVGTTGYLPPEQLMGRARPASDLYAIGATLVHLLSGKHPAEFDMHRNRLEYHHAVQVERWVRDFLDRLLEPVPEDRFATAGEALAALRRLRSGDARGGKLPARLDASQSNGTHSNAVHSNASQSRETGGEGEFDWLSRTKTTTLVDHRTTDALTFQIAAREPSRLDQGLERTPGVLALQLTPAEVEMTFESGLPTLRPEYPALALIVSVALVLAVPMAWPAKLGLSILLMAFGILSAWMFYRPVRRRLRLTPLSFELTDGKKVLLTGELDALGSVEIGPVDRAAGDGSSDKSDGHMLLVAMGRERHVVADGLSQVQARWLRARLSESLYQLRRHGRVLDADIKS